MTPDTFTCIRCGQHFPTELCHTLHDEDYCLDCLSDTTVVCRSCGERIATDEDEGDEDISLCSDCRGRHYNTCTHCGRLIHWDDSYFLDSDEDDEVPLCYTCHSALENQKSILDYYYKPDPIFYGDGARHFGVELEIDEAGESERNAQRILSIGNAEHQLIYCKHDGSLNAGFEIVTHPMTLAFHQNTMPWVSILDAAISMGYQSHRARTCGLHVHVNRTTFGSCEATQDIVIARVLYFFEKHWEELLKFSRRTESQLKRWAARYGYKEHPMDILDNAKKGYGGGRYSSVNLQNHNTVEFRMFRGTLKRNTIIATLQLIDMICDVAFSLDDSELQALSWTSFVASIRQERYPELIQYLKERRLYVNEPVSEEGDL